MRRILVFILASLLVLSFSSVKAQTTSSQSTAVLIQQLQEQIKSLQAQVSSLATQLNAVKVELNLTRTLRPGLAGDDVKRLQEFLKKYPDVYPEGLVTGYYGPLTEQAVKRLQEKQGIVNTGSSETTGFGVVGPKTISKINELISTGAGASGVVPPGLSTAPGISGATPPVTGSTVSQPQTTPIAPAQSVTTTSVSNTTSNTASNSSTQAATTSNTTTTVSATATSSTPSISPTTGPAFTLTATPSTISAGQYSSLMLSGTEANGGCFGQGTFSGAIRGNHIVYPTQTTEYFVTCYSGPGDQSGLTSTKSITVIVLLAGASSSSADTTPPSAPTNLTAVYSTPSATLTETFYPMNYSWVGSSDTQSPSKGGYKLYRGGLVISELGVETLSNITMSGFITEGGGRLQPNTAYTYYVVAYDGAGNVSASSNSVAITTPSAPVYSPPGSSATTTSILPKQTISQIANVLEAMQMLLKQIQEFIK